MNELDATRSELRSRITLIVLLKNGHRVVDELVDHDGVPACRILLPRPSLHVWGEISRSLALCGACKGGGREREDRHGSDDQGR